MAPVVRALKARDGIHTRVCVTAQHRDMLDEVLRLFDLPVDHDLDLMTPRQTLTQVAIKVLAGVDKILAEEPFDWVLVQGDTTTTMAAAQAAFHRRVRVGHVEAGLRTWKLREPFSQGGKPRAGDALSGLLYAPPTPARRHLLAPGFPAPPILV